MPAHDEEPIDLARRLGMPSQDAAGAAAEAAEADTHGSAVEELAQLQHIYDVRRRRRLAVTMAVTSVLVAVLLALAVQVGRGG